MTKTTRQSLIALLLLGLPLPSIMALADGVKTGALLVFVSE